MRRYVLIGCGALTFVTGCGGCGSGVSQNNIAKFSRTRSPEELDSVVVAAPPPAAAPKSANAAPAHVAPTSAEPRVISADDPTPIPASMPNAAPPPPMPAPRKAPTPGQPLVIDADDPTPIPQPAPAAAARSLPPGVIDADDPTPVVPAQPAVGNRNAVAPGAAASTAPAAEPPAEASDLKVALAALHLGERSPTGPARTPPPSEEEQADIKRELRALYRDEVEAARTAEARQALAKKLLADAEHTKAQPPTQFVILLVARDLAARSGDLATAMQALDQLEAQFDVDLLASRVKALEEISPGANKNAALNQRLWVEGEKTLGAAIEHHDFDLALALVQVLTETARRLGDRQLAARQSALKTELEALKREYREVPGAAIKLQQDPDDAAANLIVGRYLCLLCNRWEEGLPLLAKGEDVRLKVLASIELGDKSPKGMVELGDEWWDLSQKSKSSVSRAMVTRAAHWYGRAIEQQAQGIERLRAEKRLMEARGTLGKDGLRIPGGPNVPGAQPVKPGTTVIDAG